MSAPTFGLLGPLSVLPDGREAKLKSPRRRALLAALLLAPEAILTPDALLAAGWGDTPPPSGAATLRTQLTRLRALLAPTGADLSWHSIGYRLNVDRETVDVHRFERLVADGDAALEREELENAIVSWRAALGLWRGPALVEFCDREFAAAAAARLEESRRTAAEALADAELRVGRPGAALAVLEDHLLANPLRERGWATRMRALYASHRQAEALAAYRALRARLAEDLGIEPSPELRDLEILVLRQDLSLQPLRSAPLPVRGPLATAPGRTPFVGREEELAVLVRAARCAADGVGGLILLPGEPGVGKTRLADQAARAAVADGCAAYSGHCYERAGAPPYVAVVEILEAALAEVSEARVLREEVLGDAATEVARLLPQLRNTFPDLPAPMDLPAEQARRWLFRCLIDTVTRLAAARPLLLTLDDLQWADEATLALLADLAPQLHRMPVLLLATYRPAEARDDLADLLADLHRRRLAENLTVRRLTRSGTAELLKALAARALPEAVVDRLHERTEGNPFFVEEVYRHLREVGDLDAEDIPEGVRLVIRRRVSRLSDRTSRLLTTAAVAGRVLPFALLADLDGEESDTLDAVDEARAAMLLVDVGPDLMFSHELVRQALVADLSGPRRELMHRQAADAKARLHAENLDEHAAEIVHHLLAAGGHGCPTTLARMQYRAGRRALETAAWSDAVTHLEAATEEFSGWSAADRGRLFHHLGDALQRVGRIDDAIGTWDRATGYFTEVGDLEAIGQICHLAALALAWAGRMEESIACYQRGLTCLGELLSPTRARILAAFAGTLGFAQPALIDDFHGRALELAQRIGDAGLLGVVHGERCFSLVGCMRPAEGLAAGLLALPQLRAAGDYWRLSYALHFLEANLFAVGRFVESAQVGEELEALLQRLGNPMVDYGHGRTARQRRWSLSGSLSDLEALGSWDRQASMALGWSHWTSHSHAWSGWACHLRGNVEGAERHLVKAMELARIPYFEGFTWGTRAHLLAATGHGDESRDLLDGLAEHLPAGPGPFRWGQWAWLFATVECRMLLDEPDAAGGLLPQVLAARPSGIKLTTYIEGRLYDRVVGLAAAAAGDWELAEESFRAAAHQADTIPHQLERWVTRDWHARVLRRRGRPGDAGRARALFGQAAAGYRAIGAPLLAARAAASARET